MPLSVGPGSIGPRWAIHRGTTFESEALTLKDDAGATLDLTSATVRLLISRSLYAVPTFEALVGTGVVVVDAEAGQVAVRLSAIQTASFASGTFVYELTVSPSTSSTINARASGPPGSPGLPGWATSGAATPLRRTWMPETTIVSPSMTCARPVRRSSASAGEAASSAIRVVCDLTQERTHGRRVGWCYRQGQDVAEALIRAGLARDCPRYSRGRYAAAERPEAAALPFPDYCRPR